MLKKARSTGQLRETLHPDANHGVHTKTSTTGHQARPFKLPASPVKPQQPAAARSVVNEKPPEAKEGSETKRAEGRERARVSHLIAGMPQAGAEAFARV